MTGNDQTTGGGKAASSPDDDRRDRGLRRMPSDIPEAGVRGDGIAVDGGTGLADGADGPPAADVSPALRRFRAFSSRFVQNRLAMAGFLLLGTFVLVAVFAPEIALYEFDATNVPERLASPNAEHPFGTDRYGRDLFSRVVFGSRIALQVAVAVPLLSMVVGVPIGLVAGYVGGRVDDVLMRLMDAIFAFPSILLGLTLVAVFGRSLTNIIIALAIVFVPQFARITRGSAVSVVEEDHVKVARSLGASHLRVVGLHVFPFCLSAILVQATIVAALAIILESSLSFLGVGVQPPRPSWGLILRTGKGFVNSGQWWYSIFPGLAIVFSVLGFNLLGDGLRDVLDPRTDPDQ